jgi:hypothetical protein
MNRVPKIDAKRMRRRARFALLASAALSAILLTSAPAMAGAETPTPPPSTPPDAELWTDTAEGPAYADPYPSFPAWYDTAEGPAYADSTQIARVWSTNQEEGRWPEQKFLKVVYWLPGSAAPEPTQSDIEVTLVSGSDSSAWATLSESHFIEDVEPLVDVFVLHQSSSSTVPLRVSLGKSVSSRLVVERSDFVPYGECELFERHSYGDENSYDDVQVVALGQSGIKYRINLDVTFGERDNQCESDTAADRYAAGKAAGTAAGTALGMLLALIALLIVRATKARKQRRAQEPSPDGITEATS